MKWIPIFLLTISCIWSEIIETFYGSLEVEEPVLIELIHSPAFERLKHVHQYGVSYYIGTHPEEYTRHAHSLGVFAVLRIKNASLEEQIAGLLHDVSHTAFSHVGDWVFAKQHQENDYQSSIHNDYLTKCGIEEILNRHGYTVEQVSPKRKEFQMLEQPLPHLCADRIDYNIQGAYFQHFLSYEEALRLLENLEYRSGKWIISDVDLAVKLTRFSLFMTENCWGSATNWLTSLWLAEAIVQGIQIGLITEQQFFFGIDQEIWELLSESRDPLISQKMEKLRFPHQYFQIVDPDQTELFFPFKCRGIDPWIDYEGKIVPLTSLYPELNETFQKIKTRALQGWPVKILD